ncbi:hypothetical protein BIW11_06602 [Tropilaelaps mercedesae]|uniref:Uncharacterized protein n=1 Tax=Tropilaelaps mercedesae TaxID=418985 RepID=A0A1V9XXE8_9ACAR|nr:hypothetical protein BIW11_06602 [Tropilaelaps mercedesae]
MSNIYDISSCGGVPVSAEDRMRYLEEMHTRLVEYAAGMSDTNEYLSHRLRMAEEKNEQLQWKLNETELCLQSQPKKAIELRLSEMRRLELEGVIAYLNEQLEIRDNQIDKLKLQLSAKDHELQALLDSSVRQVQAVIDAGRDRADDALRRVRHYVEAALGVPEQATSECELDDRQAAIRDVVERVDKWAAQALERGAELQKYTELFTAFESAQSQLNEALAELALVYSRQADDAASEDDFGLVGNADSSLQTGGRRECASLAPGEANAVNGSPHSNIGNCANCPPVEGGPRANEAKHNSSVTIHSGGNGGGHAVCYSNCAVQTDNRFDGCAPSLPPHSTMTAMPPTQIGPGRPPTAGPPEGPLMSPPETATTPTQQQPPFAYGARASLTRTMATRATRPTQLPEDASLHRDAVVQTTPQTTPQTIESSMEQTRRLLAAYTASEQFAERARLPAPYRGPQQAQGPWQSSPPGGRSAPEWQMPTSREFCTPSMIPSTTYSPRGIGGTNPFDELAQQQIRALASGPFAGAVNSQQVNH